MAREMKDSGVPWIGKIPKDWLIKRIKYLSDGRINSFIDGDWIESPHISDSGIRYLTTGNIGDGEFKRQGDGYITTETVEKLNCKYVYPGDLVISRLNAPYGRACILPDDEDKYIVAVDIVILRTIENKSYLCYLMQCKGYQDMVKDEAKGTTMKRISRTNLGNISLPIPSRFEQNNISAFLNRKCAKINIIIEKIHSSIEEYKKLRQAIITQTVTKGICGNRPMKDSGIEWIKELPTEWDIIPSKYVFSNSDERKRPDDELLTASQKHGIISQQKYMEREDTRIVLANKGIEDWKHVEPYDFIISLRSFQGGLEMSEVSGCITWHYIVLKAKMPLHSFYFKWLFKSELYIKALQRTSNFIRDGQDLRYSNFTQVPLFIPPMTEQVEIANYLNEKCAEIDALIDRKSRLLSELEAYKKSLIYEYITGKKDVAVKQTQQVVVHPCFSATIKARSPRFAQAVLMSKVLDECRIKMGRVKLEKIMYVLENDIGFDFGTEYVREAAGPLDASIYECEGIVSKRNKWFTIRSSNYGVSYKPAKDFEKYKIYYTQYFSDYEASIDRIINIFKNYSLDQAEVIATLYGAWNDFIIDGSNYTDDDIVDEVLNNWNDSKKRFPKDMWLRAIKEMRRLGIVPHGYGRHTVIREGR